MPRTLTRSRTAAPEHTDTTAPSASSGGWGAFNSMQKSLSTYPDKLEFTNGEQILIKFLESAPVVAYAQHWIERQGKKSFVHIDDDHDESGDGCPLCNAGLEAPKPNVVFNVAVYNKQREVWVPVIWVVTSIKLARQLENFSLDAKTSPLDRENLYWAVTRTGEKNKPSSISYNVFAVNERQLVDPESEGGWGFDESVILRGEKLDALKAKVYAEDKIVSRSTAKQLNEIVDELNN